MSEAKFQDAKGQLAFSQQLVDKMKAQQSPQMPQEQPSQAPQEAPQAPEQPTPQPQPDSPGIAQTIQDILTPFMDKIIGLFKKQENEVKQVELKIDGEMTPKE